MKNDMTASMVSALMENDEGTDAVLIGGSCA
jgi:hypothetical protein